MKEPNIRLRALELEDLDFLYHIENDDRLWDCLLYTSDAADDRPRV